MDVGPVIIIIIIIIKCDVLSGSAAASTGTAQLPFPHLSKPRNY